MAGLLAVPVEVVVDLARHGPRDALHRLEIGEAGAGDRLGGAEMQQQRLLAPGADAWHLVEHRAQAGLGPPGAVGADGEAVRLVAQRSEEHTSELQSLLRISYAVSCLTKKKKQTNA